MNTRTKQIAIFSLLALLCSIGILSFLIWQINQAGQTLAVYTEALQARNEKEATYMRVSRLVQDTENDRAQLAQAFFTDESESISLLNDMESFAVHSGIILKTEGLDKITRADKSESILITFSYSGNYDQVRLYTEMLENLPYHSHVDTLSLHKNSASTWEGRITIAISMKSS